MVSSQLAKEQHPQNKLMWIQGRKIAVCEPDVARAQALEACLNLAGLQMVSFPSSQAVSEEIARRHYTTHRVYLAILIDFDLAKAAEQKWTDVTNDNPSILETPVVLMHERQDADSARAMQAKKQVRFTLEQPVSEAALHQLLRLLNRWKGRQHPLAKSAEAPAKLSR